MTKPMQPALWPYHADGVEGGPGYKHVGLCTVGLGLILPGVFILFYFSLP